MSADPMSANSSIIFTVLPGFKKWQKLMKNEKYVCLAGSMGRTEKKTKHNKLHIKYLWIFEKIKTLKGCDSYFTGQCEHA